jgi:hypothetical protein
MNGKSIGKRQKLVSQFWHNYSSILEKSSIPAKSRPWYRKHVKEYLNVHQGVKLQQHSPQLLDEYLTVRQNDVSF